MIIGRDKEQRELHEASHQKTCSRHNPPPSRTQISPPPPMDVTELGILMLFKYSLR